MRSADSDTSFQNYTAGLMETGNILPDYSAITRYYDIAGPDYESWSSKFNMHFGYYRRFTDIFFLERMLENMNDEVLNRLKIDQPANALLADLGCGVGAVARFAANKFPGAQIKAITISDYQVGKANSLNEANGCVKRIELVKTNFEDLDFADETFDYAYAVESSCYANGSGKSKFIAELARVLKKGGRFCIADGFIKHHDRLPRFFKYLYNKVIRYWALPCFGNMLDFRANLVKSGFRNIKVEEITNRIVPSVLYVPWTCIKFFAKEIWKNRSLRMKKERWHNVYAPVLGMVLGIYRRHFGYFLVSGQKMS